ncbi:hypothetical protein CHS0354_017083 [Potamilus streckersoni]|uniref:Uncharacterized protein n=1 Tax=Potamilus streckersoni TaxID=2493646 RepID=A0AAE0SBR4_9BIVA|nr:hypothetical protein CHS0354_017083 [Potamilus streckersoni]
MCGQYVMSFKVLKRKKNTAGFLALILLAGALLFNPFQNEGDGIKLSVTNEVNTTNGADADSQSSSNSSAFANATFD